MASMDRRLLMERSVAGRRAVTVPEPDVPLTPLPDADMLRDDLQLPEVTEGEVVRYFSLLSQLHFSIDTQYYPLGSCTMKYNPKLNDEMASLPGFSEIHPPTRAMRPCKVLCSSSTSYRTCLERSPDYQP
jgi:glycine dehydrogenase subunit 2